MSEKPRIVVVDDNEEFANLVAAALAVDNEVGVALDGREGLDLCLQQAADLMVADIGMPNMDAFSMLREMKKHPQTASMPVIILTATHFNTVSKSKLERDPQVCAILHKPCRLTDLAATVKSVLESRRPR